MRFSSWIAVLATGLASAQEQKHVTAAPIDGSRPVTLNANSIQREGSYPGLIRLSGNVRITTPTCLPVGPGGKLVCDGYTVLTADEAVYDEASGEVEAHGTVKVSPLRHEK